MFAYTDVNRTVLRNCGIENVYAYNDDRPKDHNLCTWTALLCLNLSTYTIHNWKRGPIEWHFWSDTLLLMEHRVSCYCRRPLCCFHKWASTWVQNIILVGALLWNYILDATENLWVCNCEPKARIVLQRDLPAVADEMGRENWKRNCRMR